MSQSLIHSHLASLGQEHLLAGFDQLSEKKKEQFWSQIKRYDRTLLERQREMLFSKTKEEVCFEPIQNVARSGSQLNREIGEKLIREGKVGCLILAGGHGSRLGTAGPKGAVGVSPINGKSLFQLFSERTYSAAARAGRPLHLAVMTSPLNHAQTKNFFEQYQNFGLPNTHLHFFEQSVLPVCDDQGNWLLESAGSLLEGPDGNGNALHLLYRSGLYDQWRADGIEYVNIVLVDNPLADPFDAELIGYQFQTQSEVVLKAVSRISADEKMGVVVVKDGKVGVVEYSELKETEMQAVNNDGTLRFSVANTSLFSFQMDFIGRIAANDRCILPLHLARKQASTLLTTMNGSFVDTIKVWKYETFIFDILLFARQPQVLLYPRHLTYAPLKNATGEKSLKTVQEALFAFDRHIYKTLSGLSPPDAPFELHPSFYYLTRELSEQWKGKQLPIDFHENPSS